MSAPVMAAVIVRTDKEIVRELRSASALNSSSAITLPGSHLHDKRVNRLVSVGAVHRTDQGRYYLDEPGWEAFRVLRRTRMFMALGIVLVVFLLGLALGMLGLSRR